MEGIKEKVVRGAAWSWLSRFSGLLLRIFSTVILTRLLQPQEFGLLAMAQVFSDFASLFIDFGFSVSIMHSKEIDEDLTSSVFWLNLGMALLIFLAFMPGAYAIAAFYHEPLLVPLTRFVALTFVLSGLSAVPTALLKRRMRFDQVAKAEISTNFASGLLAVILAWRGFGVWSIAAQLVGGAAFFAALVLTMARWRPRLRLSRAALREVAGFSLGLFGYKVVAFWARALDRISIGRYVGAGGLGLYTRAYTLMMLPASQLSEAVAHPTFRALSAIKDDRQRVKRIHLRVITMLTFVGYPIIIGLAAVAEPFILTLYGAKWAGVIPIYRILCWVSLVHILSSTSGWLFNAQGRTDQTFLWAVLSFAVLGVAIYVGGRQGSVTAVAWSYLIGQLLLLYPSLEMPGRLVGLHFAELMRAVLPNLARALVMGALVHAVHVFLVPPAWAPPLQLGILVPLGVAAYVAIAAFTPGPAYAEIRQFIVARRARVRPAAEG
jgi:O-antigen/teichoic acid export membrane protein